MDIAQIRQDTPACQDKLFLNSAGSSLMPQTVLKKITSHLYLEEEVGGYKAAALKEAEINAFYTQVGQLLNTNPKNIAFAYHATDAYSKALSAIPFQEGDCILTTNDDYISNQIAFLSLQKRHRINILRARNLANNEIDLEHFENLIKQHQPKLVAVTHIPTNSGLIQDIVGIGLLCSKYDILYLVDACQSAGQLPLDVAAINCDFLSATGRKFLRGPRGTGFLYISDKVIERQLEPLFIDMRGADWVGWDDYRIQMNAKRFETWEFSYASLLGLSEAVRYANQVGIDQIYQYNQQLMKQLRHRLAHMPNLVLLDRGLHLCSILTFQKTTASLEKTTAFLEANKIFYSVSPKSAALIDFTQKQVDWAIRLSPHCFNTLREIEQVADIIEQL